MSEHSNEILHIICRDDSRKHSPELDCWCEPVIYAEEDGAIVFQHDKEDPLAHDKIALRTQR